MFSELKKYKSNDHFFFSGDKPLNEVCNAPKNGSGVYYILELSHGNIEIVYIGCSGKVSNDGAIKHRKNGLFERIVNGKQFGAARHISWAKKIEEEGIDALDVYWFETYADDIQDSPLYVESLIMQQFLNIYGRLPKWNKEF